MSGADTGTGGQERKKKVEKENVKTDSKKRVRVSEGRGTISLIQTLTSLYPPLLGIENL